MQNYNGDGKMEGTVSQGAEKPRPPFTFAEISPAAKAEAVFLLTPTIRLKEFLDG